MRLVALLLISAIAKALIPAVANAQPADTPSLTSRQQQLEDITVARRDFLDIDISYSKSARHEAELRLSALERAAGSTSAAAFVIELCRIAALADNGHSTCILPRADSVALWFRPIGDEFYVVVSNQENADLLKTRLIAIDGRSIETIRTTERTLHGGVTAKRDLRAAEILNRPDLLQAVGLADEEHAATYRLKTFQGLVIERRLAPAPESSKWIELPSEHLPWSLQDGDQVFRWHDAPEIDAVVVQLRQNVDEGDQKIADFLEKAEMERVRLGRSNVVLDMRWNEGGNFLLTRDFMIAWPARVRPPGRFFVLIGPSTFSAGIADVAYLKQVGGSRVILVGEPPGDRLNFFSEGGRIVLPHSGLILQPATQRDDFQTGCRKYSDCFAAIAQPGSNTGSPPDIAAVIDRQFGRKPLTVRTLDPDIPAPWAVSDYEVGRDPAMTAISAHIAPHN